MMYTAKKRVGWWPTCVLNARMGEERIEAGMEKQWEQR